jgi:predicted kinase
MGERIAKTPVLFVFAGLPGAGKSTLARALAREIRAVYIRIDTIEQSLRDLCSADVKGEGYRLGYRIALDNLRVGLSVVADSCNPIELTRREWKRVAFDGGAAYVNIEVVCSDIQQHRSRVESRVTEIAGLRLPTWKEVMSREYHPWTTDRLVVDTARRTSQESQAELVRKLRAMQLTEYAG